MEKIYSDEGNLVYEGETKNGKPYGKGKIFWSNGTIHMEGTFGIKGLLNGVVYNKEGKKRFEGHFRVNKGYGPNVPVEGILYDSCGQIISQGKINVNISGLGYPTIEEVNGFNTSEYAMPISPYMWEDESGKN